MIILNARQIEFYHEIITYEEILELEGLKDVGVYTCVYSRGRNGENGFIYRDKPVKVTDGMIISIGRTDNA